MTDWFPQRMDRNKRAWLAALAALLAPALSSFGQFTVSAADRAAGHALGHVIVKFRTAEVARVGRDVRRLGLPPGAALMGDDLDRFQLCRVPAHATARGLVEALNRNPFVEYAELDHVGEGGLTPNDPSFPSQWHLNNNGTTNHIRPDIRATSMWAISTGSSNVILGILDTGIDAAVTDLASRIVAGYDFVNNDANPADDNGHGTAVAGTAAAIGNNGYRSAGVDWTCRIMPLKVLDSTNYGFYSVWARGIDWARTNGAKVLNLSAGGSSSDTTLSNAIMNAINAGMVFVTITHNDGAASVRFPGRMLSSITVGATRSNDVRRSSSNYGPEIDLVAPGEGISTVSAGGSVLPWSGTSFAAPQVAGVCAILAGLATNLNQERAQTLLCAGADDQVGNPAEDTAGFDNYHGWGRLNGWATLQLAMTTATAVRLENGAVHLAWPAPSSASNKQPYRISHAATLTGAWTTAFAPTNVAYSATNAVWTDNGTETGGQGEQRFYRIVVDEQ
jgi:hypothetical protein